MRKNCGDGKDQLEWKQWPNKGKWPNNGFYNKLKGILNNFLNFKRRPSVIKNIERVSET